MEITKHPSPNFEDRDPSTPIDTIVLHSISLPTEEENLEMLCCEDPGVSAHYLIKQEGEVLQLVEEHKKAMHCGKSYWQGREWLNGNSIGIELSTPNFCPFSPKQMQNLAELCLEIVKRYNIPQTNIVAHSDISPDRKEDPGVNFNWELLAKYGVGLWPKNFETDLKADMRKAMELLAQIGYKTGTNLDNVLAVKAFQRRYRPALVDGKLDDFTHSRIVTIARLVDEYRGIV